MSNTHPNKIVKDNMFDILWADFTLSNSAPETIFEDKVMTFKYKLLFVELIYTDHNLSSLKNTSVYQMVKEYKNCKYLDNILSSFLMCKSDISPNGFVNISSTSKAKLVR